MIVVACCITSRSRIAFNMAHNILVLCTLYGIVAFTGLADDSNEGLTTTLKETADTHTIITEITQNATGPTTQVVNMPPPPVQPTFTHTTERMPYSLWDHISQYFSDFQSQVVALNSEFCGRTCNFNHSLKAAIVNNFCDDCSCRASCQQAEDCCPDLVVLHNQTSAPYYTGCVADTLPPKDSNNYYIMTDRCPNSYNVTHVKTACEQSSYTDWANVVPHFDVDSGISFRNIYCAKCHGHNNSQSWPTFITCSYFDNSLQEATSHLELFKAVLKSKACYVHWLPSVDMHPLRCRERKVVEVIAHCNVTGMWEYYDSNLARACSMFSHVVFGEYRNVFCYMCNQDITWYYVLTQLSYSGFKGPMRLSLTALIDFDYAEESQHPNGNKPNGLLRNISNESVVGQLQQVDILFIHTCVNIL